MEPEIVERLESNVRVYGRSFPAVFDRARGALIFDESGTRYLDFFAGAGSLNYGHNPPVVTEALIDYLREGRIVQSLDQSTVARRDFLEAFEQHVLAPRNLDYRIQFPGPTGTNAVEAALKLARLVRKRRKVLSFTGAYHGHTLGSLAVTTCSAPEREKFFGKFSDVEHLPFDDPGMEESESVAILESRFVEAARDGDPPAAVIVETIQGDGGINVARSGWLLHLQHLCRTHGILLIVDDIQMGNGRTGPFFSFEDAGLDPDILTISKSLGGGMPLSMVLMKPELDIWESGEHTGTFRGNNLAFVAASKLLHEYWSDNSFSLEIAKKSNVLDQSLARWSSEFEGIDVRGGGMVRGIEFRDPGTAHTAAGKAFEKKLLVETCGSSGSIIKLLPPLTIERSLLDEGLDLLGEAMAESISAAADSR